MIRNELQQSIVDLLRKRGSRLLGVKEIFDRLPEHDTPRDQVERAIGELEQNGVILAVRGKRYSLLEFTPYHAGVIRVHPDGHGTLRGSDGGPDIHVDRKAIKGAMNGDLVIARVEKDSRRVKNRDVLAGEVTRVLQRAHRTVVGRFHERENGSESLSRAKRGISGGIHDAAAPPEMPRSARHKQGGGIVVPFDVRLDHDIAIDAGATLDAIEGEMVNVEIDRYPDRSSNVARGRVVERLGFIGDPGVDIEVVIRKFHIPHNFPDEVLSAADQVPVEVSPDELTKREDLREHNIVTIDGETAKDFDDAVEVTQLPNGNYLLGVHIADVAHYVTEGSILNEEAFERGTSVYFPGRAIAMLPERLSNGICSLNPRVERLTFSVDMEIDARGRFVDHRIYKSVIKTKERMTYTDVNAILTDRTPELEKRYAYLIPDFERMHALYKILRTRREARGSIDFDLPEADVMLSESGEIESIQATERNVAHRIIEEFMLSANEVVAQELVFANQPGIFRVHQQPDPRKLEDLREILKEFKLALRGDVEEVRPGELQRILKTVVGTPEERFLTNIVLRSMKRAFYAEENLGHFALALDHYCHFTSPIRRYPDLIVHRRLAELLLNGPIHGERLQKIERAHPLIALQSSERERRAEEAEREVLEWKKVIFMRDRVGEHFTGIVTGIAPFGLFVELDEIFVQGMVPIATVGGDYWQYREREHRLRGEASNRELRLGDHVKIEVKSIDEDRHQIEFRLLEVAGEAIATRER